jgi:hypothetical protein
VCRALGCPRARRSVTTDFTKVDQYVNVPSHSIHPLSDPSVFASRFGIDSGAFDADLLSLVKISDSSFRLFFKYIDVVFRKACASGIDRAGNILTPWGHVDPNLVMFDASFRNAVVGRSIECVHPYALVAWFACIDPKIQEWFNTNYFMHVIPYTDILALLDGGGYRGFHSACEMVFPFPCSVTVQGSMSVGKTTFERRLALEAVYNSKHEVGTVRASRQNPVVIVVATHAERCDILNSLAHETGKFELEDGDLYSPYPPDEEKLGKAYIIVCVAASTHLHVTNQVSRAESEYAIEHRASVNTEDTYAVTPFCSVPGTAPTILIVSETNQVLHQMTQMLTRTTSSKRFHDGELSHATSPMNMFMSILESAKYVVFDGADAGDCTWLLGDYVKGCEKHYVINAFNSTRTAEKKINVHEFKPFCAELNKAIVNLNSDSRVIFFSDRTAPANALFEYTQRKAPVHMRSRIKLVTGASSRQDKALMCDIFRTSNKNRELYVMLIVTPVFQRGISNTTDTPILYACLKCGPIHGIDAAQVVARYRKVVCVHATFDKNQKFHKLMNRDRRIESIQEAARVRGAETVINTVTAKALVSDARIQCPQCLRTVLADPPTLTGARRTVCPQCNVLYVRTEHDATKSYFFERAGTALTCGGRMVGPFEFVTYLNDSVYVDDARARYKRQFLDQVQNDGWIVDFKASTAQCAELENVLENDALVCPEREIVRLYSNEHERILTTLVTELEETDFALIRSVKFISTKLGMSDITGLCKRLDLVMDLPCPFHTAQANEECTFGQMLFKSILHLENISLLFRTDNLFQNMCMPTDDKCVQSDDATNIRRLFSIIGKTHKVDWHGRSVMTVPNTPFCVSPLGMLCEDLPYSTATIKCAHDRGLVSQSDFEWLHQFKIKGKPANDSTKLSDLLHEVKVAMKRFVNMKFRFRAAQHISHTKKRGELGLPVERDYVVQVAYAHIYYHDPKNVLFSGLDAHDIRAVYDYCLNISESHWFAWDVLMVEHPNKAYRPNPADEIVVAGVPDEFGAAVLEFARSKDDEIIAMGTLGKKGYIRAMYNYVFHHAVRPFGSKQNGDLYEKHHDLILYGGAVPMQPDEPPIDIDLTCYEDPVEVIAESVFDKMDAIDDDPDVYMNRVERVRARARSVRRRLESALDAVPDDANGVESLSE